MFDVLVVSGLVLGVILIALAHHAEHYDDPEPPLPGWFYAPEWW